MPYQQIDIEVSSLGVVMILPNGIKLSFGTDPSSREISIYNESIAVVDGLIQAAVNNGNTGITGFLISEITDPSGKVMRFIYESEFDVIEFGRGMESRERNDDNNHYYLTSSTYIQKFTKPILKSIIADTVLFIFAGLQQLVLMWQAKAVLWIR